MHPLTPFCEAYIALETAKGHAHKAEQKTPSAEGDGDDDASANPSGLEPQMSYKQPHESVRTWIQSHTLLAGLSSIID